MTRSKFDDAACSSLADCVKEIERGSNAELVIVVRARSGSYVQADLLFGALIAFAGLLFLLFSPVTFHQVWVVVDVVLLFLLGSFISSRSNSIRRLLTTKEFRATAVRTGAAATFYEAGIANTDAAMGVLVYLSLLERRLELIADRGVLKAVPAQSWNEEIYKLHRIAREPDTSTFVAAVRRLGELLSQHLPATGENPNELPDMPRFELK